MELSTTLSILTSTLLAYSAVNWIFFKVLKIALLKGLVDNPDARKLQKTPVPVLGGIAEFFGVLSGLLVGAMVYSLSGHVFVSSLLPVMCAMGLMLYIGAMDDIIGLSPLSRLVIEVLAVMGMIYASGMCIDDFNGMWGIEKITWWLAVPLTVFAGVGIINSINMIDGVNGLSSGLCISCCIIFGLLFAKVGDVYNAALAFTIMGALIPFFVHNVFGDKSRMFIGDAGTMVMGILMTWFLINMLSSDSYAVHYERVNNVNIIAMGLAVLSVPVFDTLRVMTMRMLKGKSPFQPDKTHLHHVFIQVGISHFVTAMSEIFIGIIVFCLWTLSVELSASLECQLYIVILVAASLVWGTYAFLRYHESRQTKLLHAIQGFSPRTHLGRKDWWKRITAWLDAPEEYYTPKE